jgi:hypothetical protein
MEEPSKTAARGVPKASTRNVQLGFNSPAVV